MKLAIIGSRSIKEIDFEKHIKIQPVLVVSGGAVGVDTLAENWAKANGIATLIIKPDYARYGRVAPLIRNKDIVKESDFVIAFWDGKSKGTEHTINYAKKAGKRVEIILVQ